MTGKFNGTIFKKESVFVSVLCLLALSTTMPFWAQFPLESTRKAQFAGSWYEGDGTRLGKQLDLFLANAQAQMQKEAVKPPANIQAIIVPHAGYMYSGQTAAFAYSQARSVKPKRVFILGPSHQVNFSGVALPMAVSFATPLGDLDVDKEIIGELKAYPIFQTLPDVHRNEHSLELQLPFIKQTFGDVKIVPLVVGQLPDEAEVRLCAEILKGFLQEGDLVVVSSDFTHFGPRYDYRPFQSDIRANIKKLDMEAFDHLRHHDVGGFLDFQHRTRDTICGFYPCAVLSAMLPADCQLNLLKYATSQDTTGEDADNSVSYLAVSCSGHPWPVNPRHIQSATESIKLTTADKQALLRIARKSLETHVREDRTIKLSECGVNISPIMKEPYGVFVTLYKQSNAPEARHGKELRGCIGNIWPVRSLAQSVLDNAVSASARDYRFRPVEAKELDGIELEISVLTPPRRVNGYQDIVIGRDGIVLGKHGKQSVFLPFVPTEFGWNLETTLKNLALKAGLNEDDWKDGAKFDVFQSVSIEEKH